MTYIAQPHKTRPTVPFYRSDVLAQSIHHFFQRNELELVDVRNISSLVHVDLSENKLISIHGLEDVLE